MRAATLTTARLKTKLTGSWLGLLVRVEAEAPHRITGLGLQNGEQRLQRAKFLPDFPNPEDAAKIKSNLDMFLGTDWTAVVLSNYGRGSTPVSDKLRELVLPTIDAKTAQRQVRY